ncbi:PTS sugar transporter subunit IIC [Aerococcaceae bacterium zg-ZUI334]|uniref:PTS mannose/fructose/sorbose/N-acetylgalactosamine transporter subunit IIC n=1 Tax=Aerococcaceae TaxID=186827 RepID=UPI0013B9C507|nr:MULTISPECIES: PTS sugar transporter subunit IIC [unclassified Facklamia]MBR7927404.1 PTS sugar transporter subunit IIC [Aerococcaceae bacterium zg-ZUI334]MBS4461392.1 PTS sugar transporter subunit IIC [Aerococcaceae bacterium zg-B36]QQD65840.1 PTS sugar transporter subunit IIC [Aerococcaceae bacterium zg-252]NEW64134.1 PTS sugar transporter subunit IIC [Facklamia sp. 252]NEW67591.1 PTS sugar transporter subunit IIC [Facklamia sp. 253]
MGNFIQIVLIFIVTFIAAIDQFNLLESLYQPIVMGPVIGLILGDVQTGLLVGGTYQLMTIGNMPVGGAQPPNAVIGGIMATVLAISLKVEPAAAVGLAIPFALLGQYAVTLIFTIASPLMSKADTYAENADPDAIDRLNYIMMASLGLIFAVIVTLFFVGGTTYGENMANFFKAHDWVMKGLSAAGGMMRFVGFGILLKVMVSRELWGFYFIGFALALIVNAVGSLGSSALLILAFIGFALAYWDYQIQTRVKRAGAMTDFGGDEDGI